jgi:hypothetical protein
MASLIQLKQIESSSALITAANIGTDFSQSVIDSLNGATLKNITISTTNADQYSLIISGAIAIVDANGLSGSFDADIDTSVPAQIYLVSGSNAPSDPIVSGSLKGNIIDLGEW